MSSLVPFVVATLGAVSMALAFPKTNVAALAPVGAAGLFWTWFGLSPRRAFWAGWLAGTVFFAITFRWFGETAGALIAPFGFVLALGPAIADAFFSFAVVGLLVAVAARALSRRDPVARGLTPLACAAIFAVGEWLHSEGLGELAVPFGSLGYTQVNSPFAPVAAFAGSYGITFLLCVLGAYAAYAIRLRGRRGSLAHAALAFSGVLACVALAWAFWPAKTPALPHYRVAAVQGNIPQSFKFAPGAAQAAVERYTALTLRAGASHPAIVVWPETVIPLVLNQNPALLQRFRSLAKRIHSELVVGTLWAGSDGEYNVLYFFGPRGTIDGTYRKRQLVPFAEHIPFAPLFTWIPWTRNISHFSEGSLPGILAVDTLRFAPIVCWESGFTDLIGNDVRSGASALMIATDDAWFGTSAGPYQHAQAAQMRALETGRWIVRAASTGISGIIAPNGRYTGASALNQAALVTGAIGEPVATVYGRFGGNALAGTLLFLYVAVLLRGLRARA